MQIKHYFWVIRRWLWLIIIGTVLCTVATLAVSYLSKPLYQADALMQVNSQSGASDSSTIYANQDLAVKYALLVTQNDTLTMVMKQVHGVTIDQLRKDVSDSQLNSSDVIQVNAQDGDPQLAIAIANATANGFIQVENTKNTANTQLKITQATQDLNTTQTSINAAKTQLTTLVNNGADTTQIALQKDAVAQYQNTYDTIHANIQALQQQLQQESTPLVLIQPATTTTVLNRSVARNTAIAALLGLVLMIILALLLDWIDVNIKTAEDVKNLAQLRSLGDVPLSKAPLLLPRSDTTASSIDRTIEQAFTGIGLSLNMFSQKPTAFMFTSVHEKAGSTTSAIDAALVLTHLGRRVLLIDMNLHQPALAAHFHHPNTQGLTNNLPDLQNLQPRVLSKWLVQWQTPIKNLWLLPTGPQSGSMFTIQHVANVQTIVEHLLHGNPEQHLIDVVIFDAPSMQSNTDAMVITQGVDGTILVVEAGKENKETLQHAADTFRRLGAPVIGVIVNRRTNKHQPYIYAPQKNTHSNDDDPEEIIVPKIYTYKNPASQSGSPSFSPSSHSAFAPARPQLKANPPSNVPPLPQQGMNGEATFQK
mgnify:CR=1 FL=1